MIAHAPYRRLALAQVDGPLEPAEREELAAHVATCDACRSYVAAIHRDAADLRELAHVHAPDRVRAAVLRAAAGSAGRPANRSNPWRLLLAAALLLVGLLGSALAVGTLLDRTRNDAPLTWAPITAPELLSDPAGSVQLDRVAALGTAGGVRLVATSARGGRLDVIVSDDGRTWRPGASHPFGDATVAGIEPLVIAGSPGLVAYGTVGDRPAVWTSTDGSGWAAESVAPRRGRVVAVAAHAGRLVAVGGDDEPAFWSRTLDGGTWTPASIARDEVGPDGLPVGVVVAGGELVAIGDASTYRSTDGLAWTERTNDLPSGVMAVVAFGDAFVGVGQRAREAVAWRSSDGTNWVAMQTAGDARTGGRTAVVAVDGRLVAVGTGASGARAWLSTDGRGWNEGIDLPDGVGGRVQDVAVAGGALIAVGSVGSNGAIWRSTEGTR